MADCVEGKSPVGKRQRDQGCGVFQKTRSFSIGYGKEFVGLQEAEEFQGGNRGKHIGTEEGFWPEAL